MQPPFQPPPYAPPHQPPPFQSPQKPAPVSPPTPPPVQRGVSVMDALRFTTSGPNGWNNLLFCGLLYFSTQIIPIAGLLVMQGFFAEVHRRLVLQRPEPYVRFDFSDLTAYLTRSIAPFVVALLVALPFGMILGVMVVAVLVAVQVGAPVGGGSGDNPILYAVLAACGLAWLPLSVFWLALQNAAVTRAELTGDLGKTLKLGAIWSYAGKTWKPVFWTAILTGFLAVGLLVVGLMACVIGMFVTLSMLLILQMHLRWQIYNRYLLEGGEPIELAPWELLASELPKGAPPGMPPGAPPLR